MTSTTAGSDTSSRLLARLRARDGGAWDRLAELYGPLVFYWCRRFGLQDQDAADVLQEVFAAVAAGLDRFQHEQGRFRGWLWTIARSKIHDHFRRRSGRPAASGGTEAQHRLAQVPEKLPDDSTDQGLRCEHKAIVHEALQMVRGDFAERTWQAFWRVTVAGQSTADVAADLGMSVNQVRQSKSRVLRRLREELGDLM